MRIRVTALIVWNRAATTTTLVSVSPFDLEKRAITTFRDGGCDVILRVEDVATARLVSRATRVSMELCQCAHVH